MAMNFDDVNTMSGGGLGSCLTHPLQHQQRVRSPEILVPGANDVGGVRPRFSTSWEKRQLDLKECAIRTVSHTLLLVEYDKEIGGPVVDCVVGNDDVRFAVAVYVGGECGYRVRAGSEVGAVKAALSVVRI